MLIIKRILIILLIFMMVFSIYSSFNTSFAINGSVATSSFNGENANMNQADEKAYKVVGTVLDVVRIASVSIGLVMLTVLGAKYMLASPNERAEIKQHLVVYVVGAFVMFGASALVTIIQKFTETNVKA